MSVDDQKIYTLSAVARAISKRLEEISALRYWVQAEVTQPKEVGGHMYATLVELANGKQVAKLNCAIWHDSLVDIRRKFAKEELTFEFTNGTKVCLLCSVSFHATGGLRLVVHDADTSFQLGEMERKRREIIQRLEAEKLHERNRALAVPMLPRRIGLITGKDSAAMNDILRTLRDSGFGITVLVAESLMQGDKCEVSILRSFDTLVRLGVDVITIARGGGGKSELAGLDNEAIARRIAQSTIPVWTAIGHETDISVLDFVAHTRFKTPTALAEEIIRRYHEQENSTNRALDRLRREWIHRLETDTRAVAENVTGIRQGTRKLHDMRVSELRSSAEHLRGCVSERVGSDREQLAVSASSFRNASRHAFENQGKLVQGAARLLGTTGRRLIDGEADALMKYRGRFVPERITRILGMEQRQLTTRVTAVTRAVTVALAFKIEVVRGSVQRLRHGRFSIRLQGEVEKLSERHRFVLTHDPLQQLKRGYALVHGKGKQFLKSVTVLTPGDVVDIEFHDGIASANIQNSMEHPHGHTENV